MVHFTRCDSCGLFYSAIHVPVNWWVTPFGDLRVNGYVLLTAAFRSLSRPSSPYSSQASAIDLCSLDHIIYSARPLRSSVPGGPSNQARPPGARVVRALLRP